MKLYSGRPQAIPEVSIPTTEVAPASSTTNRTFEPFRIRTRSYSSKFEVSFALIRHLFARDHSPRWIALARFLFFV